MLSVCNYGRFRLCSVFCVCSGKQLRGRTSWLPYPPCLHRTFLTNHRFRTFSCFVYSAQGSLVSSSVHEMKGSSIRFGKVTGTVQYQNVYAGKYRAYGVSSTRLLLLCHVHDGWVAELDRACVFLQRQARFTCGAEAMKARPRVFGPTQILGTRPPHWKPIWRLELPCRQSNQSRRGTSTPWSKRTPSYR
jgi:hypothetical protein